MEEEFPGRPGPEESLIQNLEGRWPEGSLYYLPEAKALEQLVRFTGVDFGYDVAAWRNWLKPPDSGFLSANSKNPAKKVRGSNRRGDSA